MEQTSIQSAEKKSADDKNSRDKNQSSKINSLKVPIVHFTEEALSQLELITENDFTVSELNFRIQISGKGCDGFTYSLGMSEAAENDFRVIINGSKKNIYHTVLVDPFTAFYFENGVVDFERIQTESGAEEGFKAINLNEGKYTGKFWKDNPQQVPPKELEVTQIH